MRLNILYIAIGGWRPLFSKKMAVAYFFLQIGSGSQYLVTLLEAVLTWSEVQNSLTGLQQLSNTWDFWERLRKMALPHASVLRS